jgi:hypothetical protein
MYTRVFGFIPGGSSETWSRINRAPRRAARPAAWRVARSEQVEKSTGERMVRISMALGGVSQGARKRVRESPG